MRVQKQNFVGILCSDNLLHPHKEILHITGWEIIKTDVPKSMALPKSIVIFDKTIRLLCDAKAK